MKASDLIEAQHKKVEALFSRVVREHLDEESLARAVADCLAVCLGMKKIEAEESKPKFVDGAPRKTREKRTRAQAALESSERIARAEKVRAALFGKEGDANAMSHLAT